MSSILILLYVTFAVLGSTLLKLGSAPESKILFVVPYIKMAISWTTFCGFIAYGLSFLLYTFLLSKYELSFISPLTVGLVYICLMITAFLFFNEQITFLKLFGSSLILIGILLIIIKK